MIENKSIDEKTEENKKNMTTPSKEKTKSKNIFQKYPFVFIVLGALIISVLWGVLKVNRLEKAHSNALEQINLDHQVQLDSMALVNASQVISSLTWAVRSEMTRDNMEQVNTYFIQLIKEPSIETIQLVDHSTGNVLLSTNKKDEGTVLKNEFILSVKAPISKLQDKRIISAAPVYGLSEQLGVLVIERTR
jgi:hypothetical protein